MASAACFEPCSRGLRGGRRGPHHGERRPHRDALAGGHEDLVDDAVLEDLDIDVGLVGVDHRDDVATAHRIAGMHQPFRDGALVHVGSE